MGKKEFDEYLRKQQANTESRTQIDWNKKRDEWLKFVEDFYKELEGFLGEYTKSGDVTFDYREKDIHEDFIGQYRVKSLLIRIKNKDVVLDPVGTNLIGAKGRIDMTGEAGVVKFVLVDKNSSGPRISVTISTEGPQEEKGTEEKRDQIEWGWKIATSPPRIRYIDINAESFFDALMEVING